MTPDRQIEAVARALFEKFGVQCTMPELDYWRPIARASIEALAALPDADARRRSRPRRRVLRVHEEGWR